MCFTYILALICLLNFQPFLTAQQNKLNTYIVHVNVQPEYLESWYNSILPTNHEAALANDEPRILYHYRRVFSGFAAKLSDDEVESMRQKNGFISARRARVYSLHTTHSSNFLGLNLNSGFWNVSNYGKGVIIGVLDTGITPDHPSFDDKGLSPPPSKWKGGCQFESKAACNNKLIGAKYVRIQSGNLTDQVGHGTHTAATVAGNFVNGANIFGNANGTAVGIAPLAHLAVYKVCQDDCLDIDIVAGIDAAIEDGVDILSMSIGGGSTPFHQDIVAIAAYNAVQKGIFVSCSAGNNGPTNQTIENVAPWILTVGASTIDRKLRVTATLGTNEVIEGESAFQPNDFPDKMLGLVTGGGVGFETFGPNCDDEIKSDVARGKIVFCQTGGLNTRQAKGQLVKNAGGAAMILMSDENLGNTTLADAHVLPAMHITYSDGLKVQAYLNSNPNPTATISFKGTVIGDDRAPVVAGFSARGPSLVSPGILKPDIIGPGVNILAAWLGTKSSFNMISGTSMSCPHLSGVAALLKSAHPDWSPAAIKSAIMTTADQVNLAGDPIEDQTWSIASVFATGAGHVDPSRANDPGLVYDIQPDDYIPYLCGLNYTNEQVSVIVQQKVDCSRVKSIPDAQLNYPSFSILLESSTPQTYTRTVMNVGEPSSSYTVQIVAPSGVNVTVKPVKLQFSKVNQKLEYNVTFTGSTSGKGSAQGFISWNSASRSVRSPIAVVFK
ncbi:hypothetical protein CASFOL_010798 [Castilleja foliolosa]|uniref:Uncharacterized protein n=1 Tax=Castilleja foliolosa TaxID=1961234 RepID=A0ABD3DU45_9LAMI